MHKMQFLGALVSIFGRHYTVIQGVKNLYLISILGKLSVGVFRYGESWGCHAYPFVVNHIFI